MQGFSFDSSKGVEFVSVYDTAGAARRISEAGRTDEAGIASEQAALDYGLAILSGGDRIRT